MLGGRPGDGPDQLAPVGSWPRTPRYATLSVATLVLGLFNAGASSTRCEPDVFGSHRLVLWLEDPTVPTVRRNLGATGTAEMATSTP